jgi:hypothetical protein
VQKSDVKPDRNSIQYISVTADDTGRGTPIKAEGQFGRLKPQHQIKFRFDKRKLTVLQMVHILTMSVKLPLSLSPSTTVQLPIQSAECRCPFEATVLISVCVSEQTW